MKIERSFVRGRMNKSVDERLLPQGEYVDAMNIRFFTGARAYRAPPVSEDNFCLIFAPALCVLV